MDRDSLLLVQGKCFANKVAIKTLVHHGPWTIVLRQRLEDASKRCASRANLPASIH